MRTLRIRHLAAGLCLAGAVLAIGPVAADSLHKPRRDKTLPVPARSGIEHVVLVTMENRSFDHLLGWHPTADGQQAGLSYPDEAGVLQPTHALAPDFQGCGHPDPDHSW